MRISHSKTPQNPSRIAPHSSPPLGIIRQVRRDRTMLSIDLLMLIGQAAKVATTIVITETIIALVVL